MSKPKKKLPCWERRQIVLELLAKDPRCHWCHAGLDINTATIEHLLPLFHGGTNQRANLRIACLTCNNERGNEINWSRPAQPRKVIPSANGMKPKKKPRRHILPEIHAKACDWAPIGFAPPAPGIDPLDCMAIVERVLGNRA